MSCDNHAEMNRKHEETQRQIDAVAARITALEIKNAGQDEKFNRIFDMLEKIESTLEKLTAQPGRRWEQLISVIIAAAAGGFLAWLIK
jgi:uncharacterized coiled-coil protein SlyX